MNKTPTKKTTKTPQHWSVTKLRGACPEAKAWARRFRSLQAAWDACTDPEWMRWWSGVTVDIPLDRPHREPQKTCRACAEECAIMRKQFLRVPPQRWKRP